MAVAGTLLTAGCQGLSPEAELDLLDSRIHTDPVPEKSIGRGKASVGSVEPTPRNKGVYSPGSDNYLNRGALYREAFTPSGEPGATLNLVNVSIGAAAKVVLGDILGRNYVVDPKVKGTITVQTSQPVEKSQLIDIFESALSANGAAIVESNGLTKVVPAATALQSGPSISIGTTQQGGDSLGTGTQIVPLRYVSAAEMERILEPLAPPGSIVRADVQRNIIVLSGTASARKNMLDTIAIFDVDWMRGMSFALVPVKTEDPDAMALELDAVFATGPEKPLDGIVQFIPNKRLRSVLVISAERKYLRRAVAWIKKLDRAAHSNEKKMVVYNIKNRQAEELAVLIEQIFTNRRPGRNQTGSEVAPTETPQAVGTPRSPTTGGILGDTINPTRPSTPTAGTGAQNPQPQQTEERQAASEAGAAIAGREPRIRIVPDSANNAILVYAAPNDHDRIKRIIGHLDVTPHQVLLEATIAEVTLTDQLKFGLKWFFNAQGNRFTLTDVATGAVAPTFPGFSYFFSSPRIRVALDALNKVTDVNVISSPSLMVLDNRKAILQIGDQVPITTSTATGVITPNAPIVNTVEYRDTGVILTVTPRIAEGGRVNLEIEQEVSNVVATTTSQISSPTIQQRRIKTTVVVNDGSSLALGGLIQDRTDNNKTQLPVLGDIPILGNVFKQRDDTDRRTELLIVITPRVVRDQVEARKVTDEFRRQMNVRIPRNRAGKRNLEQQFKRVWQ